MLQLNMFGKTAKMIFLVVVVQRAGKVWAQGIPPTWAPHERQYHQPLCHPTTTAFIKALLGINAGSSHKTEKRTACLRAAKQLGQGFCVLCLGVVLVLAKGWLKKQDCYRKLRVSLW